jgi:hypothetical protein
MASTGCRLPVGSIEGHWEDGKETLPCQTVCLYLQSNIYNISKSSIPSTSSMPSAKPPHQWYIYIYKSLLTVHRLPFLIKNKVDIYFPSDFMCLTMLRRRFFMIKKQPNLSRFTIRSYTVIKYKKTPICNKTFTNPHHPVNLKMVLASYILERVIRLRRWTGGLISWQ